MQVKLCGFTEIKSLQAAVDAKCDFVGFVFYPKSPRYITVAEATRISQIIPQNIAKVAVVVNADLALLQEISDQLKPQYFQFHGDEDLAYLQQVRKNFSQKIIKAITLETDEDLQKIAIFKDHCDMILLDAKPIVKDEFGGSGRKWNWEILSDFNCNKGWILAGGLNATNIADAIKKTKASIVDISSGIEEARGVKSEKLIAEFMAIIHSLSHDTQ